MTPQLPEYQRLRAAGRPARRNSLITNDLHKLILKTLSSKKLRKKKDKKTIKSVWLFSEAVVYSGMEITEDQINKFIEDNDMMPLGGDMFEDAGGHVWHEANIIDEIKNEK